MIVTLELPPGGLLSETALMEQLEIGRTPIREAIQRLSNAGLISILPRRCIMVTEINPAKQLKVLELRRVLERLIAEKAAKDPTPQQVEQFTMIAEGLELAGENNDEILFLQYDDLLHASLTAAADNEYASTVVGMYHGMSRRFWYAFNRRIRNLRTTAELHAILARAVAKGDIIAAARASDKIISDSENHIRSTLGQF